MDKDKKTVHIRSLGCPMRDLDADNLKSFFVENSFKFVNENNAYYNIYVTCGLNESTIDLCISTIRKNTNDCKIIITGCLPAISPQKLREFNNANIFPVKEISKIADFVNASEVRFNNISQSNIYTSIQPPGRDEYTSLKHIFKGFGVNKYYLYKLRRRITLIRNQIKYKNAAHDKASIRISTGCVSRCSFCGIRYAIGKLQSKPINSIIEEYKNLIQKKYYNIVLLADDTGSYGLDINSSLPQLLNYLNEINNPIKTNWIFQDLNPQFAIQYKKDLLDLVKKKFFYEILFSIQSGSDTILDKMKRKYNINELLDLLKQFRKNNTHLRILSNFIVGFPSETDEDFENTITLIKSFRFDFIYLMPYFENEVCDSRHIYPKISKVTINYRLKKIENILKNQKTDFFIVS